MEACWTSWKLDLRLDEPSNTPMSMQELHKVAGDVGRYVLETGEKLNRVHNAVR
jgi:hypothetical protein